MTDSVDTLLACVALALVLALGALAMVTLGTRE